MITSRQNARIKNYIKLSTLSKERRKQNAFTLEGARLCFDAVKSGLVILECFYTEKALLDYGNFITPVLNMAKESFLLDPTLINAVSQTKTPQGIFIVCEKRSDVSFTPNENGEPVTNENGEKVTQIIEVITKTEVVTNADGETVTDENGVAVTEKVTQTKPYVKPTTTTTTKANSGNVTPPTTPPKPVTTTKPNVTVPATKPPVTTAPTTEKRVTASNVGEMRKELQAYAESLGMIWDIEKNSENGSWTEPLNTASFSYERSLLLLKRDIRDESNNGKKYINISIEPYGNHYLAYTLAN